MYERQRFVIYSDNDRLFEHEIIEEMVQRLRIPMSSIHVISDDDKSTSSKGKLVYKNIADSKIV